MLNVWMFLFTPCTSYHIIIYAWWVTGYRHLLLPSAPSPLIAAPRPDSIVTEDLLKFHRDAVADVSIRAHSWTIRLVNFYHSNPKNDRTVGFVWKCWVNTPNEIAICYRDNDQQNHWVLGYTTFSDTPSWTMLDTWKLWGTDCVLFPGNTVIKPFGDPTVAVSMTTSLLLFPLNSRTWRPNNWMLMIVSIGTLDTTVLDKPCFKDPIYMSATHVVPDDLWSVLFPIQVIVSELQFWDIGGVN